MILKFRHKILLLIFCMGGALHAQPWAGLIQANRATNWSNAGVQGGIPNRTQVCATLSPGASANAINSAISSCGSNQVVVLNAGTYNLNGAIRIGSKSNVTVRGAGANQTLLRFSNGTDCSGLGSTVCFESDWVNNDSPQNSTTWTSGYAPGTSAITVGSTSGMQVGDILILDQVNDSSDGGAIFVCSNSGCTDEGGNAPGRNNRGQQQLVKVVSLNGNQVSISPPIRMPNWRSSQNPGVFWNGSAPVVSGSGIEDVSIDVSGANGENGVVFMHVSDCWVKGVRVLNPDRNHVWLWQSMRITIRDSYFYGGQSDHSTSYGVEDFSTGDNLVENNIFQHVTAPLSHNGANTGSVFGYNFAIDDNYTAGGSSPGWMIPGVLFHEVGISHLLHEGNDGLGVLHDDIHGTTHFNTLFRNHFYGDIWNSPSKSQNTEVIHIQSYGRFFNVIGNVLGRTGYYNTYEPSGSTGGGARNIYTFGDSPESGVPNDPQVKATILRWGNYDTVTGNNRFNASEVPNAISQYANPVPGNQSLPPSFYLPSKPSWWGSQAWPPIGPDVSGGDISGYAGHANKIPSRLCYENTSKTSGVLNFSASACYGSSQGGGGGTPPNPPTSLSAVIETAQ